MSKLNEFKDFQAFLHKSKDMTLNFCFQIRGDLRTFKFCANPARFSSPVIHWIIKLLKHSDLFTDFIHYYTHIVMDEV